jgi:pyruvate/2-oxoglutarate dehydrogenase complex dihydrolipoamide acyltransferase (E2) component
MEIRLVKWVVEEGMRVTPGQLVCIVESEKATQAVEAPEGGILRQLKQEGDVIASPHDAPFRIEPG